LSGICSLLPAGDAVLHPTGQLEKTDLANAGTAGAEKPQ